MSAYGHLLRDRVQVSVYEGMGYNEYGDPIEIWSDPFPVRCRIEGGNKLVRDSSGHEVVSERTLITDMELPMSPGQIKVWLADEDPATDVSHRPKQVLAAGTIDGRTRLWEVNL